jgi:hypothetical protein
MLTIFRRTPVARYDACVGFSNTACEVTPVPSFVRVADAKQLPAECPIWRGRLMSSIYRARENSRLITTVHFLLAPNWTGKLA